MARPIDFEAHSRNITLIMRQRERSNALFAWCKECEKRGDPSEYHRLAMLAMLCTKKNYQHNTYLWLLVALDFYPAEHFFNDDGSCLS